MTVQIPRIAASSYLNTAPLVWSFLYGTNRGRTEVLLDFAPARSAEMLSDGRVQAALVPVIASQFIDGVKIVPDVCVGAEDRVRSVCLITKGADLEDVRSVSLDTSSRTSVALTKIIFREFLGFEPAWFDALPNIDAMLEKADAALIIGDPALILQSQTNRNVAEPPLRVFDLAALWNRFTGLGFVFAMWMTTQESCDIDFASARDEGLANIDRIISNYEGHIGLSREDLKVYLRRNIHFSVCDKMRSGLALYLELAEKHKLISERRPLRYVDPIY